MDELEISGKRYISSKRVARENKYHADYIGQLIRAGKIAGTKVGRAWYVEEGSFAEYLGKERAVPTVAFVKPVSVPAEAAEEMISATVPVEVKKAEVAEEEKETPIAVHIAPAPAMAAASAPAAAPASVSAQRPSAGIYVPIHVERPSLKKTNLTYIADHSPLLPEIIKRPVVERMTPPVERIEQIEHVEPRQLQQMQREQADESVVIQTDGERKRSNLFTALSVGAIGIAAVLVFAFVFFGSLGFNSTVIVEKGKPASVELSQEKTFCFIFNDCQNN